MFGQEDEGEVPGGERVGGDLGEGEEFVAVYGAGAVLAGVSVAGLEGMETPTLSSFIKRLRSRSTSSRSTVTSQCGGRG